MIDSITFGTSALVCMGLSSIIGIEREFHSQPAGFRTHVILGMGACLASALSIAFSHDFSSPEFQSDPARIVAQVVSGVGFLGAGAIMRFGVNVKGITTASSLWTTAIIGIACGGGYYEAATVVTAFVMLALVVMRYPVRWLFKPKKVRQLKVRLRDRPRIMQDLRTVLESKKVKIISIATHVKERQKLELDLIIQLPNELKLDTLINVLNTIEDEDMSMFIGKEES
jgi:putative Mg2+ transporter-C (MgtC) family protein